MPYPSGVARFNITGSLAGGEQIVHSLWMKPDGTAALGGDYLQAMTDKVRDEWAKTMVGPGGTIPPLAGFLSSGTRYTAVSGYLVDALGKATAQSEATFATPPAGSVSSTAPPSIAICVTLHTNKPGRTGRGRLYLGGLSNSLVGAEGRFSNVPQGELVATMTDFYKRLRDSPFSGDPYRPVVVSRTRGEAHKIVKVSIGDVFDTMRSRRTSLKEARQSGVVDAS